MTLPLGTIVRLLGKLDEKKFQALGSLNNLYQSLKDFPECYLSTEECKFMLLNPESVSYEHCRNLKLKIDDTEPIKYFICGNCWHKSVTSNYFYSICNKAKCTKCGTLMAAPAGSKSNACVGGGVFVSDLATFIVTDNFTVMPFSAEGILGLLTDCGITDMSHLEEETLELGSEQMLYLLKLMLTLDSPLTRFIYPKNNGILNSIRLAFDQFDIMENKMAFDQCDNIKIERSASSMMVLEVTLQKSTGKLLFAEAKEDFVDLLFGILSVPLGTVVGTLLNGASSVSSLDNIYKSISNMSVGRYKSQDIKDMLLKPHFGQQYSSKNQLFSVRGTVTTHNIVDKSYHLKDPRLDAQLLRQSGMFLVTDDLVISPPSSNFVMNTLEKLKVPFYDIKRHEINFGLEEGLGMLKALLRSKSILTKVLKHQLKD